MIKAQRPYQFVVEPGIDKYPSVGRTGDVLMGSDRRLKHPHWHGPYVRQDGEWVHILYFELEDGKTFVETGV